MLRMFIVCFMITFSCAVVGSGLGLTHERGEWLMVECILAAMIGALGWRWYGPLSPVVADDLEFDIVDEDNE